MTNVDMTCVALTDVHHRAARDAGAASGIPVLPALISSDIKRATLSRRAHAFDDPRVSHRPDAQTGRRP
jgi:predicted RecA/RadA family phage recombinase